MSAITGQSQTQTEHPAGVSSIQALKGPLIALARLGNDPILSLLILIRWARLSAVHWY
jgi:hypothetical protein